MSQKAVIELGRDFVTTAWMEDGKLIMSSVQNTAPTFERLQRIRNEGGAPVRSWGMMVCEIPLADHMRLKREDPDYASLHKVRDPAERRRILNKVFRKPENRKFLYTEPKRPGATWRPAHG